jgi:hypothetical protein
MKSKLYLVLVLVVGMCLAGWTAHAKLHRNTPERQTWEYTQMEFDVGFQSTPEFNQLGAQAWE